MLKDNDNNALRNNPAEREPCIRRIGKSVRVRPDQVFTMDRNMQLPSPG